MEESLAPRSPPGCDGNIMGEPGLCGGMKKVQGKAEVGTDGGGGRGRGQLKRYGASGRRGLRQLGVPAEVVGDMETEMGSLGAEAVS